MIQYRGHTFETNSSSAHSIVLVKNKADYYKPEEAEDELWLYFDPETGIYNPRKNLYFGRAPFRVLCTFRDKLNYAYACAPTAYVKNKNGKKYRTKQYWKISREVHKFIPDFKRAKFDSFYDGPSTDDNLLFIWLKELNITLVEFLTNKNIIVVCDGDEYCIWHKLKTKGLINSENIVEELR